MNKSENKVRVTNLLGGGGFLGMMDPKVGMKTNFGPILILDSGNNTVVVGVGSGSYQQRFYPHQLYVGSGEAYYYGFPGSGDVVLFGHYGVFPNGIPLGQGSGTSYMKGNGSVATFGRVGDLNA